ncbi:MAG: serine/threonine-protein kinase [Rudaea sp.]
MSAPGDERWRRVAALFDTLVETPAAERERRLGELCVDDAALRAEIEGLLRADAARSWDDGARSTAAAGERIGAWRVLGEIGRGGMGIVFLAERADGQYEQRAALKLVKRGMDSEAILARFLRERQILARLAHPHIARLLDGGMTAGGLPYLVMEYVEGQPLLDFCGARGLRLKRRVELFLDICSAVQFAHGQLVVHRDIKPSNILVDAGGSAKLLDFGIAKLLDAHAQEAGDATELGQPRPLTAAYAAPEQLRGEPVGVATDVYSLGCVLYEMLAGRRPFATDEAQTVESMRRLVETTLPKPPSQVAGGALPARELRGDLDTIVLKALQREPQRRYATVDAFNADLRNLLVGLPIAARRDRVFYRAGKFVSRHPVGVALSILAIFALLASSALTLWQARAKTREAQASAEVTRFLAGLFQGADPTLARGATITAQDLLDQGSERLRASANIEPAVRARLLQTIAATYTSLGLYDRALMPAREALDLRRAVAPDQLDAAESLTQLGRIYRLKADYAQAAPLLREGLRVRRRLLPADDARVIESLADSGALSRAQGNFQEADAALRAALEAAERRFGNDASETARALDDYAANLDDLGKRKDAESAYRRALGIREKSLGKADPEVATSMLNLGVHLDESGEYDESAALIGRALATRRAIFGPEHPLVGIAEMGLAGVEQSLNRLDEADQHAQHALAVFRHSLPSDHPRISEALNMLAVLRMMRRDFSAGVPIAREVVERFTKTLGGDHPDTLTAKNNLAYALQHAGDLAAAEKLQRDVLGSIRKDDGQNVVATDMQNLATTLQHEGKGTEAVVLARRALDMQREREGTSSGNVAVALRSLAFAEESAGDYASAERDLRSAVEMGEQLAQAKGMSMFGWRVPLADLLAGRQRCAEAIPYLQASYEELSKATELAPLSLPEVELLRGYCGVGATAAAKQKMVDAKRKLLDMPGIRIDMSPFAASLLDGR